MSAAYPRSFPSAYTQRGLFRKKSYVPRGESLPEMGRREAAVAAPAVQRVAKPASPSPWVMIACERSADGWVKSTRAMAVPGGVLVNTCTRHLTAHTVGEATVFVPGATVEALRVAR